MMNGFDFTELDEGAETEHTEHEVSPEDAAGIAMDHLQEDPDYYTKLKKVEGDDGAGQLAEQIRLQVDQSGGEIPVATLNSVDAPQALINQAIEYGVAQGWWNYNLFDSTLTAPVPEPEEDRMGWIDLSSLNLTRVTADLDDLQEALDAVMESVNSGWAMSSFAITQVASEFGVPRDELKTAFEAANPGVKVDDDTLAKKRAGKDLHPGQEVLIIDQYGGPQSIEEATNTWKAKLLEKNPYYDNAWDVENLDRGGTTTVSENEILASKQAGYFSNEVLPVMMDFDASGQDTSNQQAFVAWLQQNGHADLAQYVGAMSSAEYANAQEWLGGQGQGLAPSDNDMEEMYRQYEGAKRMAQYLDDYGDQAQVHYELIPAQIKGAGYVKGMEDHQLLFEYASTGEVVSIPHMAVMVVQTALDRAAEFVWTDQARADLQALGLVG